MGYWNKVFVTLKIRAAWYGKEIQCHVIILTDIAMISVNSCHVLIRYVSIVPAHTDIFTEKLLKS